MPSIGSLVARLGLDDKQFKNGLVGAERRAKSSGRNIAAAFGGLAIGAGLIAGLRKSIDATIAQEEATKKLAQAITATGRAGRLTVSEVESFSASLQKVTTFGDESTTALVAFLLQFRNIGEKVLPRATKAILDFSAFTGRDAIQSAKLFGIALNDPVAGMGRLSQAGVSLDAGTKELIKTLAESGRLYEAQGIFLTELEKSFEGAAKAARRTLGGSLKALGNAFGDLFEQGAISGTRDEIERLIAALESDAIKNAADAIGEGLAGAFRKLAESLAWIVDNKDAILTVLGALQGARFGASVGGGAGAVAGGIAGGIGGAALGEALSNPRTEIERLNSQIKALEAVLADAGSVSATGPFAEAKKKIEEQIEALKRQVFTLELGSQAAKDLGKNLGDAGTEGANSANEATEQIDKLGKAAEKAAEKRAKAAADIGSIFQGIADDISEITTSKLEVELAQTVREVEALSKAAGDTVEQTAALVATTESLFAKLGEVTAAAETKAKLQAEAAARAEDAAAAFEEPFRRAAENIQRNFADTFTSIFRDGIHSFEDFADSLKDIFARLAGEITALLVFNPSAITSGAGGILGGIFGGGTSGGAGGGGAGGILSALTALFSSDPSGSNFGVTGGSIGPAQGGIFDNLTLTLGSLSEGLQGLLGSPGLGLAGLGALGFGGVTAFGAGGKKGEDVLAASASGLIGGALVGGYIGTSIFPGIGTVAGAVTGAALGEAILGHTAAIKTLSGGSSRPQDQGAAIGQLIGGLPFAALGYLIGGLFYKGVRKSAANIGTNPLGDTSGFFGGTAESPFGQVGLTTSKKLGDNQEFVNSIVAIDDAFARYLSDRQIELVSDALQNANPAGISVRTLDQGDFRNLIATRLEDAIRAIVSDEQFLKIDDADAAVRFALAGGPGLAELGNQLSVFFKGIKELSLGIRTLSGEEITQAERAINSLNDQFDELVPDAVKFGVSLDQLSDALDSGISKIGQDILDESALAILKITDPIAAALQEFEEQAQRQLDEAIAAGVETILIERRIGLERNKLIERLGEEANSAIDGLIERLTATTSSPLPFAEILANANDLFQTAVAAREGGDFSADLAGTAANLVEVLRSGFASGEGFFQGVGEVPGLERILEILEAARATLPGGALDLGGTSNPTAGVPVPTGDLGNDAGGSDASAIVGAINASTAARREESNAYLTALDRLEAAQAATTNELQLARFRAA